MWFNQGIVLDALRSSIIPHTHSLGLFLVSLIRIQQMMILLQYDIEELCSIDWEKRW